MVQCIYYKDDESINDPLTIYGICLNVITERAKQ